jgi:sugar-specific transcriptional regulator TrmB
VVLESLIKKGLCSTYKKKDVAYYVPEDPDNLDLFLTIQKKDIEEKQVRLKGLLEQLKTVYSIQKTEKPFIRFFEGKKGLLASRNEALASKNKLVRMIYPLKAYMNVYSEVERNDAHARRVNNQVKARILYTKDTIAIDDDHSRTATEVDETQFPLHADIALYDNKVRIASLNSKLTGVIIEDEEICKTMNSLFELAWVGARYLQSKKKK